MADVEPGPAASRAARRSARLSTVVVIGIMPAVLTGFDGSSLLAQEPEDVPVSLEPGGVAVLVDTLSGRASVDYEVPARAGQILSSTLLTDHRGAAFNVIAPDAENEAEFIGSSEGRYFKRRVDLDGVWTLRLYLVRAAARRGEQAGYTLRLGLGGSPDPSAAREANDFGPREWDARGNAGCARGGQPMQTARCPFKVLRYDEGATIFLQDPDRGTVRILYFDRADPDGGWSTPTDDEITVFRRADIWTITAGDEAYEIVEAVVYGG